MQKSVSPAVISAVVALAVLVLGFVVYRQLIYTPPTPRINLYQSKPGSPSSAPPQSTAGH